MELTPEKRKELALELYNNRQCPGCGRKMGLWEMLAMLRGSGVREHLQVQYADGARGFLPIEEINPRTMDARWLLADRGD